MMPTALRAVLCACLFVCLSAVLPATPITTSRPFPIVGSGEFIHRIDDGGGITYYFNGAEATIGAETVIFIAMAWFPEVPFETYLPTEFCIDKAKVYSGHAGGMSDIMTPQGDVRSQQTSYCLGAGGGFLELYDEGGEVIGYTELITGLRLTEVRQIVSEHDGQRFIIGSFEIYTPTPEPSTWALAGVSLLGLAWWRRRQYPASVQR